MITLSYSAILFSSHPLLLLPVFPTKGCPSPSIIPVPPDIFDAWSWSLKLEGLHVIKPRHSEPLIELPGGSGRTYRSAAPLGSVGSFLYLHPWQTQNKGWCLAV